MIRFMRIKPILSLAAVGIFSLGLISILPPPAQAQQVCTQEYAPVCGVRKGDRRTFSNACHASAAGYHVTHRGECRGRGDRERNLIIFGLGRDVPPAYGTPGYSRGSAHVARCQDRYRSYGASDNSFRPYYGPRLECRSPHWG